jgi:hypothetical protein
MTDKIASLDATGSACSPDAFVRIRKETADEILRTLKGVLEFVDYIEATYVDSYAVFGRQLDMSNPIDADDVRLVATAAAARRGLMNTLDVLEMTDVDVSTPIHRQAVRLGERTVVEIEATAPHALARAIELINAGLGLQRVLGDGSPEGLAVAKLMRAAS